MTGERQPALVTGKQAQVEMEPLLALLVKRHVANLLWIVRGYALHLAGE